MYLHRPEPSWSTRLFGSARTLAAIIITALLASALTVRWSDAAATGATIFTPERGTTVAAMPVTVEGAIVGAGDGLVALVEKGAESPVAFSVGAEAQIVRGGENVPLDALRVGDSVRVTIDGMTGSVYRLHAEPVGATIFPPSIPGSFALLAAVGFIAGAAALAIRNLDRLPALHARGAATRLLPVAATR
ncbi:MAG: hypothetical protein K0Q71_269 [Thermomicrobiales bacterium]|jgi:hypothetical protein|nr:hypothetical protein [Thermomicrobiales bacterium]